MSFQTADLLDQNEAKLQEGSVRVVTPMFRSFGGLPAFSGQITTLKLFEDNGLVRKALEGPGHGRVLVVDGGGSLRRALVGDQLALLGVKNGWAGLLVYGCIRDSKAISAMELGVFALATHPRKTLKKNEGDVDVLVNFGGVDFVPGEYLYADEDGVIVSKTPLL